MISFIDLDRRFREHAADELEDPDVLAFLYEKETGMTVGWPALLEAKRVVILAEEGAGKTWEMREQRSRLRDEGKSAFFLPLESLAGDPLEELLSPAEEDEFQEWKREEEAPAWFFLDARDELRLTRGSLDRALVRLSQATDGRLHRAHVVISSRPSDWRPETDLTKVEARLPVPHTVERPSVTAEELFRALFQKGNRAQSGSVHAEPRIKDDPSEAVRVVSLLPLNTGQIRRFARTTMNNAGPFLQELEEQDAWSFARRPKDLNHLIATWSTDGRLGTLTEQHESNVTIRLKDDPDRHDHGVLSDTQARAGAERLALALALTRSRTFWSGEAGEELERTEGTLDPAKVLPDWTEEERQTLLRRGIFDPATYGRVRFHHRSIQEYLAACALRKLRKEGMPVGELLRLLFAEIYGVKVVLPSMRPIAAWLASWSPDVARELIEREPEALLAHGDPQSLSSTRLRRLLETFVRQHAQGGWSGFDIPTPQVGRLARTDLAPLVRELWERASSGHETRGLLLRMIWKGPIGECADLAREAAIDSELDDFQRVTAVKALIRCTVAVDEIVENIDYHPQQWPTRVVQAVLQDLFPEFIGAEQLIGLIERADDEELSVSSVQRSLREIVGDLEVDSAMANELREHLASLIWRTRDPTSHLFMLKGRFKDLAPVLAKLCREQLARCGAGEERPLIRACSIAARFNDTRALHYQENIDLKPQFQDDPERRELAFWEDLKLVDELESTTSHWQRYRATADQGLIDGVKESDRPWLLTAANDTTNPERRAVALAGLIKIWIQRDRPAPEFSELSSLVEDDPALLEFLVASSEPPEPPPEIAKLEAEAREECQKQAELEREAIREWEEWRREVLANPAEAFSPENKRATLDRVYAVLARRQKTTRTWAGAWEKSAAVELFDAEFADRAEEAFKSVWRSVVPELWSSRPPEQRNRTPYSWIYGLCGLSAEARRPGWAGSLSRQEARIAAAYATVELNGFAPFLGQLVDGHPSEVEAVIGTELSKQLRVGGDDGYVPILQDLAYAEANLQRLLYGPLLTAVPDWPKIFENTQVKRSQYSLEQALRILEEVAENGERQGIAEECARQYESDRSGPLAIAWLRSLFRLDSMLGANALKRTLTSANSPEARTDAVSTLANVLGDLDAVPIEIEDPGQRAAALESLIRAAVAVAPPEEDPEHEGAYSPGTRDRAARARDSLLSKLLDTPGPEAHTAVLQLAEKPGFARRRDRILFLARQRAARDAEPPPLTAADVVALEERYIAPPRDRDGLFAVMMNRLDDLAHDLVHHDFTDRVLLATIKEEELMQRTLALRIHWMANGAYQVTREEEVVDRKQPDIRLLTLEGGQRAAIEVKLAQNWSLAELKESLQDQLVGQYLRHEDCKAGCLLLTYNGTRNHWKEPTTREKMEFSEMVTYLKKKAKQLQSQAGHGIRLGVFALDLTDPSAARGPR